MPGGNLPEVMKKLMKSLLDECVHMSIKIDFLNSHLEKFPADCGDVSNEQAELFHLDINRRVLPGMSDKLIKADCCWSKKRT